MRYLVPVSPHRQFGWFIVMFVTGLGLSHMALAAVAVHLVHGVGPWVGLAAVEAIAVACWWIAFRALLNSLRMVGARIRVMFRR